MCSASKSHWLSIHVELLHRTGDSGEMQGEELKRLEWDQDGSRKLRGDGLGIKPPPVFMSTLLPFPAEVRCTCSTSAVANWHNGPASLFQEICGKKALELKQSLYI